MDEKLINDVISTLCLSGEYEEEEVLKVQEKLLRKDSPKELEFEQLRLHFTSIFLQNPKMLEVLTFKQIVSKALEFTKEYVNHE